MEHVRSSSHLEKILILLKKGDKFGSHRLDGQSLWRLTQSEIDTFRVPSDTRFHLVFNQLIGTQPHFNPALRRASETFSSNA